MNIKQLLNEWRNYINESKSNYFSYEDIILLHNKNTLYHITSYDSSYFRNGMKLDSAISLSTKENSKSQGAGIYFFCNPNILEKAFNSNRMNYLVVLETDYINEKYFLPDLELCSGFFVDWFSLNYYRLIKKGFKTNMIKDVILKGQKTKLNPSGALKTMIVTASGYVNITNEYKTYDNFISDAGKPLNLILNDLKRFDEDEYNQCIYYVKNQDIEAVKYIGQNKLFPKTYYALDKNKNCFIKE